MDLNELSAEEIVDLAYGLVDEMDKTASEEVDLNDLDADEIIELAYYLAEDGDFEKEAGYYDLNEFSVDDFIEFASELEDEMEKDAGAKETLSALMAKLRGVGAKKAAPAVAAKELSRAARGRAAVKGHYARRWERGGKRGESTVMKHLQKRRAKGKHFSEAALQRIQDSLGAHTCRS